MTDETAVIEAPVDTAESTDAEAKPVEAKDEPTPEAKAADERTGVERRIAQLTRAKYELTQKAEQAAKEAAEWRAKAEKVVTPEPAKQVEAELPDIKLAETDPYEYQRKVKAYNDSYADSIKRGAVEAARAEWIAAQEKQQSESSVRAQQEAARAAQIDFVVRAEELSADIPDFQQVAGWIPMQGAVGQAILDGGPTIAYYLGTHASEYAKLESMSPVKAAIEIGKMAAKAEEFVRSRSRSKVAPQAKPLSTAGAPASDGYRADMSMEAYVALRQRQRGKK